MSSIVGTVLTLEFYVKIFRTATGRSKVRRGSLSTVPYIPYVPFRITATYNNGWLLARHAYVPVRTLPKVRTLAV